MLEGVGVEKVLTEQSRVSEVETTAGNIKCEYFVNAAGLVRKGLASILLLLL